MRLLGWFASATVLLAAVALPREAAADTMDPALGRFVTDSNCRVPSADGTGQYYNPASGFQKCGTNDALFAKLIAQYGFAIASSAMHSARSTGYGGFELAIEANYTKIDSDADYWKLGTQGPQDPNNKRFSILNSNPDDLLQIYYLKIRKGFPFGLELTGNVGYLANTNIVTGGADVRFSVLEGFRTGVPGIFPEIAAGGSVRTITGTEEFQLTVAGFDGQISKPLPIAGTVVLTPYVGYQWIRIFGDSGLIDLTPNTDSVNYCGYQGNNTPASPDGGKVVNGNNQYDGQPVCGVAQGSADFNNTVVFDPVRLTRHRLNFGMQLRFQMVKFGAHFITDLVSPEDANKGADYESPDPSAPDANGDGIPDTNVNDFKGVKKQWTLAFDLGAVF
jgi:hypothetical protein